LAVTQEKKPEPDNSEGWMEPSAIVSDAYKSLDKQIVELDKIPARAKQAGISLREHAIKGDLFSEEGQIKTYQVLEDTNKELGQCIHAVMEIERERYVPQKATDNLPAIPSLESSPQTVNVQGTPQGQPITVKTGFLAEWAKGRAMNKAMDKAIQFQKDMMNRPEITTSKIKDVLDYGRELIPEFNKLYNFYDCGIKRVYFFSDAETVWNQRREIVNEVAKITGVIEAFSNAVVEYRKERFGDRKVGVAAGAMWLEAAKARQPVPYEKAPPPGDSLTDLMKIRMQQAQQKQG